MIDIVFSVFLSHHIGFVEKNFNQVHPHVAASYNNFAAGIYYNSERRISTYGTYTLYQGWFDVSVGIATGYVDSKVLPLVILSKDIINNVSLFVLPTIDAKTDKPTLVLGIEYTFK